jgi:hypothetical protein
MMTFYPVHIGNVDMDPLVILLKMQRPGHYYPSADFARTRGGAFDLARFRIAWRFAVNDPTLTRLDIQHLFFHAGESTSRYFGKY